jgi:hypothetical protein
MKGPVDVVRSPDGSRNRPGDSWLVRIAAAGWILVITGALVVGASGWVAGRNAGLDDSPGCIFKRATGIDCAFCGMTHATVALGAGDLSAAHHAHPLAIIVLVGSLLIFGLIVAGRTDALLRGRRPLMILGVVCAIWALRLLL